MNLLESLWDAFKLTQEYQNIYEDPTPPQTPANSPRAAQMEASKNNVEAVVRDWPNIPFGD